MERQFPKLEPVNIRVTWIDGETIYIKRMAPIQRDAQGSSAQADPLPTPPEPNPRKQKPPPGSA